MSRRDALTAAPGNLPSHIPPPSFVAAGDMPIPCTRSIHSIRAHEAAPRSSGRSDEGVLCLLFAVLARDDAVVAIRDHATAALLSARAKVFATASDFLGALDYSFARASFSRLEERARLHRAALFVPRLSVHSEALDCARRPAWASCHGDQTLPDARLRPSKARRDHDLPRNNADGAMVNRATAVFFAAPAIDAPLGVIPRVPALVAFQVYKRTERVPWPIPAYRGGVLGIGSPCRTRSAAVMSAARPYSSSRELCSSIIPYVPPRFFSERWRIEFAKRFWGPNSGRAVFAVGMASIGGSLLLLGLGHQLRHLFQSENKLIDQNRRLRSAADEKEKNIEELKGRWIHGKFAPGKA